MNIIYLADFTTMDIVVAIIYGLLSLIIGVLLGYSINSKYKKQVVTFEQENVKLNSSVSSLEAQLEETKKARSNADDEIVLLRNRVRDRDVRIRETEGKMAIISKRYEESQVSLSELKAHKEIQMPSEKLIKGPKISKTASAVSTKKKAVPVAAAVASKVTGPSVATKKAPVAKAAKVASPVKEKKVKKDKKAGRPTVSKSKKADKASTGKKRGRPAGSKSKSTGNAISTTAVKKEAKASAKTEVKTIAKKKRGRPVGSANQQATPKAEAKKVVAKRGRPKKDAGATSVATKQVKGKPGRPTAKKTTPVKATEPKRRGRPAGSTTKATTAKTTATKSNTVKAAAKKPTKSTPTPVTTRKRERPTATSTTTKKTPAKRGRKSDDLTLIEGVGPKMQEALRNAGYRTFNKISTTSPKKLKDALVKANTRFGIAATESWPTQAKMAAKGALEQLQAFQDTLNRGR